MGPECHPGVPRPAGQAAQELHREPYAEQDPGRHRDDPEEDDDPHKAVHIRAGIDQEVGAEHPGNRAARPDHRDLRQRIGAGLDQRRRGAAGKIQQQKTPANHESRRMEKLIRVNSHESPA